MNRPLRMSINPEILRRQQLQLMGITSYFPRYALPGALPSELIGFDAPDVLDESEPATKSGPVEIAPHSSRQPASKRDWRLPEPEPAIARTLAPPVRTSREAPQKEPQQEANAGAAANLHLLLIPVDARL
jgi:hypothetical protein